MYKPIYVKGTVYVREGVRKRVYSYVTYFSESTVPDFGVPYPARFYRDNAVKLYFPATEAEYEMDKRRASDLFKLPVRCVEGRGPVLNRHQRKHAETFWAYLMVGMGR